MAPPALNLAGQRFGRLRVLRKGPVDRNRCVGWYCICDCGKKVLKSGPHMRAGEIRSCGCLALETKQQNGRANVTSGLLKRLGRLRWKHGEGTWPHITVEYHAWQNAKDRCFNPRNPDYKDYGGRGIQMCEEWRNNYRAFLDEIGRKPVSEFVIDRINNEGHYEPGNVRWATPQESRLNQRPRRHI